MKEITALRLSGKRQILTEGRDDWNAFRAIGLFGVHVGIQTNNAELLDGLDAYFPPLWQPAFTSVVDRIFSLYTGKARHRLFEDSEPVSKFRSRRLLLEDFERRLKIYVAEMARRRVFVHAGAVGWKGRSIVIPGRSYSGKTSLVKALVEAGATYYSDEYAVLDMQGRVHPYPQPLALRQPGSWEQEKCPVAALGGSIGTEPLPIGLVIVSRFRAQTCWCPVQLTAGRGVLELLDNTVPARRKPEIVLATLQKAVMGATILKGDRGEVEYVVRRILKEYA